MGCRHGLINRIVVGKAQGDQVGFHNTGAHATASFEAGQVGHERLDEEDTAISQMASDVIEAPELAFLREWGKERIEDRVDKGEFSSTSNSTKSPKVTGITLPPGF